MGWSLYKEQPVLNYPSITYYWLDENKIVRYQRNISPIGFSPILSESYVGKKIDSSIVIKKVNHKMTQEELMKGWLFL